jgi:hypothetical protein
MYVPVKSPPMRKHEKILRSDLRVGTLDKECFIEKGWKGSRCVPPVAGKRAMVKYTLLLISLMTWLVGMHYSGCS